MQTEHIWNIADLPPQLRQAIEHLKTTDEPLLLEGEGGTPMGAIISPQEFALLAERKRRQATALQLQVILAAPFADIPQDELNTEVERAIHAARSELRAERQVAITEGTPE